MNYGIYINYDFLTESGEKAAFTLSGVKNNVSESEVQALMDSIIENNIFYNKKVLMYLNNLHKLQEKKSQNLKFNY